MDDPSRADFSPTGLQRPVFFSFFSWLDGPVIVPFKDKEVDEAER